MNLTELAWLACGRLRSQGCWDLGPALAQASSQVAGVLPCERQQRCVTCQACSSTPAPSHTMKPSKRGAMQGAVHRGFSHAARICAPAGHEEPSAAAQAARASLPAKSPAQEHRLHQQHRHYLPGNCAAPQLPKLAQAGRAGPPTDLCNTTVTPLQCGLARGGADIRCLFRQGSGGTGSPLTTTFPDPMLYSWRAAAACWASTGLRRPA